MPPFKMIAPDPIGPGAGPRVRGLDPPALDTTAQRSVLQFSEKLGELADAEAAYQRVGDLAIAGSSYRAALDKKRLELDNDPDVAGREEKFKTFAQDEFTKARSGIGDRRTAQLFDRSGNEIADTMATSVRHGAAKDTKDNAIVALTSANQDLVNKVGDARTDNERAAILGQINDNLTQAQASGMLTPAQFQQARRDTLVKVDQATGLRMVREDPGGVPTKLAQSTVLPNLDPVARQNLIDKALNEQARRASVAASNAVRAEANERRAMKRSGDEAMKEIIDLDAGGTLTAQDVADRRNRLSVDDYKTATTLQRQGSSVDNMNTVATLAPALGEMDMKDKLANAYLARQISKPTYLSMLERNDTLLKDDQPQSPYKRGRDYLVQVLTPGAILGGDEAAIQRQALVDGVKEYDDFIKTQGVQKIRENPQLAMDRALEIKDRYAIINFDKIGLAIGLPRHVEGTREFLTGEKLAAASQATQAELAAGTISATEADHQFRLIRRWDELIAGKAAAELNKKPKP